MSKSLKKK